MFGKSKVVHFSTISLLALALGCASQYRSPESAQEKMVRYRPKTNMINTVPLLPEGNHQIVAMWAPATEAQSGRRPASVKSSPLENLTEGPSEHSLIHEELSNHSNKRLYFMALHTQYETLRSIASVNKAPAISQCPHFHSQLVRRNEISHFKSSATVQLAKNYSSELIQDLVQDESALIWYPELALPMTADGLRPRVIDMVTRVANEDMNTSVHLHLTAALNTHATKIHRELDQLCQHGASDNYYIFENLVGHQKNRGGTPNPQELYYLMKTTVVYNHALLNSIFPSGQSGRFPASTPLGSDYHIHGNHILDRLKGPWTQDYFSKLSGE